MDEPNRLPAAAIDTVAAAVLLTNMVQSWLDARCSRSHLATEVRVAIMEEHAVAGREAMMLEKGHAMAEFALDRRGVPSPAGQGLDETADTQSKKHNRSQVLGAPEFSCAGREQELWAIMDNYKNKKPSLPSHSCPKQIRN